jgi:hypothetical protein
MWVSSPFYFILGRRGGLFSACSAVKDGHPQNQEKLSPTQGIPSTYTSTGAQMTTTTRSQTTTANTNRNQNTQSQYSLMIYGQHQPIILYHYQPTSRQPIDQHQRAARSSRDRQQQTDPSTSTTGTNGSHSQQREAITTQHQHHHNLSETSNTTDYTCHNLPSIVTTPHYSP